jgi:hypothetical protein
MNTLPLELLYEIVSNNKESYKALLAVPLFARSLTPDVIVDFKMSFGYGIEIAACYPPTKRIRWILNDKLHRADGPAVEHENGAKQWYKYGKLHREDGPAIEEANGSKNGT